MPKALMKRMILLALALWGLAGAERHALAEVGEIGPRDINAGGAVLMDVETTRVLAAVRAHERLPMASTTKVMTALLAIENAPMDAVITVPEEAYAVEGSSMYLALGEKVTMKDLLHGLMLSSGNDAAVAIATHVGGSVEGFAAMMNNRAASLGCVNTNFVTPNGLHHESHYTTAYDLALIAAEAMKNETFREVVGAQYYRCESGDILRSLKNKNKILWNYEGGNGVKTGFTKAAGRCLVFSAERGGRMLVGVELNAPDMWNTAMGLMEYGFLEHAWEPLVTEGEVMQKVEVRHGMKNSLEIVAKEDILVPLRPGEDTSAVEIRINCPRVLDAPVFSGQKVGAVEAWADGRLLKSVPLLAAENSIRKEYMYYIGRLVEEMAS